MRPKLYGVGKCGTRIVFDFSAYTYSHPTAFEVRTQPSAVGNVVSAYNRVQQTVTTVMDKFLKHGATPVRIYTSYDSVAVESDLNGNEVTKLLTAEIAKTRHTRPINHVVQLGDRIGGCGFGALSEQVATRWVHTVAAYPEEMKLDADADVIAFVCTSLGGGTGSGSAPVIARKILQDYTRVAGNRPCHVTIIGILPMTDIRYGSEPRPAWDFGDSVNTGRAVAAFLSRTQRKEAGPEPSLWLVSNDLLRLRPGVAANAEKSTEDRSISVVNWHIAAVACLISNVGGAGDIGKKGAAAVRAESNLDSAEMNQHLGGRTYFTGYASEAYEDNAITFARRLCRKSLEPLDTSYSFSDLAAPMGCGIPFRSELWIKEELDRWCGGIGSINDAALTLPAELRTAGTIGVLYGQPVGAQSGDRHSAVLAAVKTLFPAAKIQSYRYIHQYDKQDHLCLYVVDSFCSVIFAALSHYVAETFDAPSGFADSVQQALASGDPKELTKCVGTLVERETYREDVFGDEIANLAPDQLLDRAAVLTAYQRLFASYNRKPRAEINLTIG